MVLAVALILIVLIPLVVHGWAKEEADRQQHGQVENLPNRVDGPAALPPALLKKTKNDKKKKQESNAKKANTKLKASRRKQNTEHIKQ